jgi:hypothetical protein
VEQGQFEAVLRDTFKVFFVAALERCPMVLDIAKN